MNNYIGKLASFITEAKAIVALTGAGISTESGISDYRSKGGLWDRFQPVTFQEFLSDHDKRKQYWQQKLELYESLETAQPNEGHYALARLEKIGKLKWIITQNIDGLHQMAGHSVERILELHGNNRQTICLECRELTEYQDVYKRLKKGEEAPLCLKCGGLLKPNTIFFGQALDVMVLKKAMECTQTCDLFLTIGSTLLVEPAASLPQMAKARGAKLVIMTLSETPLDDIATLKIEDSIGKIFKEIMSFLKE